MISLIGTMKGVVLKSKVGDDGVISHFIDLKLEISDGVAHVQNLVPLLKQVVALDIDSRQPTLAD